MEEKSERLRFIEAIVMMLVVLLNTLIGKQEFARATFYIFWIANGYRIVSLMREKK